MTLNSTFGFQPTCWSPFAWCIQEHTSFPKSLHVQIFPLHVLWHSFIYVWYYVYSMHIPNKSPIKLCCILSSYDLFCLVLNCSRILHCCPWNFHSVLESTSLESILLFFFLSSLVAGTTQHSYVTLPMCHFPFVKALSGWSTSVLCTTHKRFFLKQLARPHSVSFDANPEGMFICL